jgi:hypothetical protein
MELKRLCRADWIMVAGALVLLLGVSLTWYHRAGEMYGNPLDAAASWGVYAGVTLRGWDTSKGKAAGLLSFVVIAAVVVKAVPAVRLKPSVVRLIPLAAGGLAFILVGWEIVQFLSDDLKIGIGGLVAAFGALTVIAGGVLQGGWTTSGAGGSETWVNPLSGSSYPATPAAVPAPFASTETQAPRPFAASQTTAGQPFAMPSDPSPSAPAAAPPPAPGPTHFASAAAPGSVPAVPYASVPRFCESCGSSLAAGMSFCGQCGRPVAGL